MFPPLNQIITDQCPGIDPLLDALIDASARRGLGQDEQLSAKSAIVLVIFARIATKGRSSFSISFSFFSILSHLPPGSSSLLKMRVAQTRDQEIIRWDMSRTCSNINPIKEIARKPTVHIIVDGNENC